MIPGMGVDPQKMAEMQRVSRHIKAVVRVDYEEKSVKITMDSTVPDAVALIPALIEQFSGVLAQQMSAFFSIQGEIVEVNKPSA